MQITIEDDLKVVAKEMQGAVFGRADFKYDAERKKFYLKANSVVEQNREFFLELFNVKEFTPLNLDKVRAGTAKFGVFEQIKTQNHGLDLTIISQDLKILLKLSKLEGTFEICQFS